MEQRDLLNATLDALDRLMKMFMIERYVYLVLTAASFLIMLYAAYLLITKGSLTTDVLVALFGGSGIVTVSSARISWFFNRAFSLVEELVKRRQA